jgi:type I restriction enzyme R subunit
MANNEHQFESDIEALMTGELGWSKARKLGAAAPSTEHSEKALDLATLVKFVKASQPREWAFFVKACSGLDPEREFYKKFEDAVATEGMIDVLRNGFYANGKHFSVCYFKPENRLNETALANYEKNICEFHRQWHYSASETAKSVDVMLSVNGIPLVAIELKDQFTGQTVENAKVQWMTDRNPKEAAFRLNHRCLVFFAVDLNEAWMTTQLAGEETRFLPFNQGSAGAGEDGGAGNPPWNLALPRQAQDRPFRAQHLGPQAPTDYLWRDVLAKDSLLDILQKFVNYEAKEKRLVFPRFH